MCASEREATKLLGIYYLIRFWIKIYEFFAIQNKARSIVLVRQ